MNPETLARLDALAAKLGVVTEHLWAVLVQQVYVSAVTSTALALVLAITTFTAFSWSRKFYREDATDEFATPLLIGATIACFFTIVTGSIAFETITVAIFNPEYYALDKLLDLTSD